MAQSAQGFIGDVLLRQNLANAWIPLLGALTLTAIYVAVRTYLPLRHIPGPFSAALTNITRRHWVQTGDVHLIHTDLHGKYGKVFRYGPNHVLISDPAAINLIYGHHARFAKSEFYDAIIPHVNGKPIPDVFATRDEALHRDMKRPIASAYAMSTLVSFEPYVKSTMELFFSRLDQLYADSGKEFDFGHWLHLFAWDVLGELTFSRKLGFLDKGGDVSDIMKNNWAYFLRTAPATQMPWLDYLWKRNPLIPAGTIRNPLVEFGSARIRERLSLTDAERKKVNSADFLSRFIDAKAKYPNLAHDTLETWTNSNIQAGSDTTAILLCGVLYYLLKHPSTMATLRKEIDSAVKGGRLSPWVTWKESQELVYLDACIKEAARVHPPIGFPLERIVPAPGITVDGRFLPAGTRVSMNPWSVHRDKEMFGEDANQWRPERWLCEEKQKKAMYNTLLTFGAGHRTCIGKNISYLEAYTMIPSLLQRYELELADPKADWSVETKWFTMPTGFRAKLRKVARD